jgi:hypothetical protein
VEVERVFSQARILMPHTRNRLGVASTRALICLGQWSAFGLIRHDDAVNIIEKTKVVQGKDEFVTGWDNIVDI